MTRETERKTQHQGHARELRRLWNVQTQIVPIGSMPKKLEKWLEVLGIKPN